MIYEHGHKMTKARQAVFSRRARKTIARWKKRWTRSFAKRQLESKRLNAMKKLGGISGRNYLQALINEQRGA